MAKTPNNRKLADLSYERVEDQRALVIVLEAAENWASGAEDERPSGDEIRAAIARVRAHLLVVTEPPKPSSELPGQIGIDGSVVGATQQESTATRAPIVCPNCNKDMLSVLGTYWTPMSQLGRLIHEQHRLQCGFCAHVEYVTEQVWQRIAEERRRAHGDADVKRNVKPGREKRIRGAG